MPGIHRKQAGFSLLEIGLVLSLVAGLTVVAMGTFKSGGALRDDKLAIEQFNALVAIVASQGGPGTTATSNLQTTLIADQLVPEAWVDRRNTPAVLRGSWGGIVQVDSAHLLGTGAYPDAVTIRAYGLSAAACVRLLMAVSPSAARVQYNTTDFKNLSNTLAITNARARTACTSAPSRTYTFLFEMPAR